MKFGGTIIKTEMITEPSRVLHLQCCGRPRSRNIAATEPSSFCKACNLMLTMSVPLSLANVISCWPTRSQRRNVWDRVRSCSALCSAWCVLLAVTLLVEAVTWLSFSGAICQSRTTTCYFFASTTACGDVVVQRWMGMHSSMKMRLVRLPHLAALYQTSVQQDKASNLFSANGVKADEDCACIESDG